MNWSGSAGLAAWCCATILFDRDALNRLFRYAYALSGNEASVADLLAIDTHCLEELIVSRDELQQVWSRLYAFEREILYYRAVEDMTAAQIASTLGSRRGTVLSRIHRLRARLRAKFGEPAAVEVSP